MLTIQGQGHRFCDGVSRRQFLRVGGLGAAGFTLADLLRGEAKADLPTRRPKSVIYVVLSGGLSHIDSWDLKPDAPADFRGAFKPIKTNVSGIDICEHFPKQAAMMDRLSLLRGVRSVENDHFLSEVYSGLPRKAGHRPAFGSVTSKLLGSASSLPAYVSLDQPSGGPFDFEKPHYAGASHAPFRPFGEAVENLQPVKDLNRLDDRKKLLASFDTIRRELDQSGSMDGLDKFQAKALEMVTSAKVREAFDLSKEPIKLINGYGHKCGKFAHQADVKILYDWDARPFIQARRLVEAGVRVVTLSVGSWDHHSGANQQIFDSYKLVFPVLDQSICALVNDLNDRGLGEDVLVVVLGEFGRSPKVTYPGPGREHWAEAGSMLFAGGGLKMGQVIGETDSKAERSKSCNISFENVLSTIYGVLGVDLNTMLTDFNGRPQNILDDKNPIRELVA
ncbi:DUF1501 domain-containing protein [Zavarzinella formosa]|uniref:DUF1501 domain-containing protein n=1 Tax=Zavarzinella formosa TaxID=360055 RepID=UPI00031917AF|nr:DUF1501 domain-containing protein [Zavarzinella formosa]